MKYVGSKNRISKYIAPILQQIINQNNIQVYYEPFVGGANMIDKIQCNRKIGNDIHPKLIAMWKAIQNGWIFPMHISEDEYNLVKTNETKFSSIMLDSFPTSHSSLWCRNFDQSQIQMYFSQVL